MLRQPPTPPPPPGCWFNKICHLTSKRNPIVEIRRSFDCLISTMGFTILVRWHLYIESGPWFRNITDISSWIKFVLGSVRISAQSECQHILQPVFLIPGLSLYHVFPCSLDDLCRWQARYRVIPQEIESWIELSNTVCPFTIALPIIYINIYIYIWVIIVWCLSGTKSLPEPMMTHRQLDPYEQTTVELRSE